MLALIPRGRERGAVICHTGAWEVWHHPGPRCLELSLLWSTLPSAPCLTPPCTHSAGGGDGACPATLLPCHWRFLQVWELGTGQQWHFPAGWFKERRLLPGVMESECCLLPRLRVCTEVVILQPDRKITWRFHRCWGTRPHLQHRLSGMREEWLREGRPRAPVALVGGTSAQGECEAVERRMEGEQCQKGAEGVVRNDQVSLGPTHPWS